MNNSLIWIFLILVLAAAGLFFAATGAGKSKGEKFGLLGVIGVLVFSSLIVYASVGRFSDWQSRQVDETKDHRLAAKITESRRAVQNNPRDVNARITLATRYMDGGLFREAVSAIDEALSLTGPRADLYGLKANASYYRDGKKLSPETQESISKAFEIDPKEVQSQMLLAQDAFFKKEYGKAIEIWQMLLSSNIDPSKNKALQNAIANAQMRLAQEPQINEAP